MAIFDTIGIDKDGNFLLDLAGNFVLLSGIEQVAQDSWLAAQCFVGDIYFELPTGIPYFEDILGGNPPDSLIAHDNIKTISDVAGVDDVSVTNILRQNRIIKPTISVLDFEGNEVTF